MATEKRGKVKWGKRRMVLTAAEREAKEKAAKAKSSARSGLRSVGKKLALGALIKVSAHMRVCGQFM